MIFVIGLWSIALWLGWLSLCISWAPAPRSRFVAVERALGKGCAPSSAPGPACAVTAAWRGGSRRAAGGRRRRGPCGQEQPRKAAFSRRRGLRLYPSGPSLPRPSRPPGPRGATRPQPEPPGTGPRSVSAGEFFPTTVARSHRCPHYQVALGGAPPAPQSTFPGCPELWFGVCPARGQPPPLRGDGAAPEPWLSDGHRGDAVRAARPPSPALPPGRPQGRRLWVCEAGPWTESTHSRVAGLWARVPCAPSDADTEPSPRPPPTQRRPRFPPACRASPHPTPRPTEPWKGAALLAGQVGSGEPRRDARCWLGRPHPCPGLPRASCSGPAWGTALSSPSGGNAFYFQIFQLLLLSNVCSYCNPAVR